MAAAEGRRSIRDSAAAAPSKRRDPVGSDGDMTAFITQRETRAFAPVAVPYCDLQKTLSDMDRVAYYSSRLYGWRFDVYRIGNVYLTTGYAPVGRQISSDICREAERIAAEQSPAAARRYLMDHIG